MMIGPAPMMRMLLMSVRFGITALNDCVAVFCALRLCVYLSRYFLRFHQRDKAIEQVGNIVRSRRRFGVPLEAERGFVGAREALQRAVEQRRVRDLCVSGLRGGIDGETVILRRDHHAAA